MLYIPGSVSMIILLRAAMIYYCVMTENAICCVRPKYFIHTSMSSEGRPSSLIPSISWHLRGAVLPGHRLPVLFKLRLKLGRKGCWTHSRAPESESWPQLNGTRPPSHIRNPRHQTAKGQRRVFFHFTLSAPESESPSSSSPII